MLSIIIFIVVTPNAIKVSIVMLTVIMVSVIRLSFCIVSCGIMTYGSFTLAKFVGENISNIVKRYRFPYLPWPSEWNRIDPICVVPPKVAKASKEQRKQSKEGDIADIFAC